MAPVYEHLQNKRLRKQNGMSLLTSRCLLSILNKTDEQLFPYSYVCRGNILKKNASKNCKQLALAQRNGYRVLPLATVATEKPRFRAHAAIFAIGVTRAREITARGVEVKDCSQLLQLVYDTDRKHPTIFFPGIFLRNQLNK